jgi:hypothetical protein
MGKKERKINIPKINFSVFYAQSTQNVYKKLSVFGKHFFKKELRRKNELMFRTIFVLLIVFTWKFLSTSM